MSDRPAYSWLIPPLFGALAGLLFGAALTAAGGQPVTFPYTVAGLIAGLASTVYLRLRGS